MAAHRDASSVFVGQIGSSILLVRGQRIILDRELAAIYGTTTKRLNEQVKRNRARFPDDFMFQLTMEEALFSRSQFATLKDNRGLNIKYLPYAFTEHGAIQVANVLNSPTAIKMGIYVVRAFLQLRRLLDPRSVVAEKINELEQRLRDHDEAIGAILSAIRELLRPPESSGRGIGFTADLSHPKKGAQGKPEHEC